MQCPLLKNINFQHFTQLHCEETPLEETIAVESFCSTIITNPIPPHNISKSNEYSDIEQTIDITQLSHNNPQLSHKNPQFSHNNLHTTYLYNHEEPHIGEELPCFEIKIPKELSPNSMINYQTRMELATYTLKINRIREVEGELDGKVGDVQGDGDGEMVEESEDELYSPRNIPHELPNKCSMLSGRTENTFDGEIYLEGCIDPHRCIVINRTMRITKNNKTVYFIELTKGTMLATRYQLTKVQLTFLRESRELKIIIIFNCANQADAFLIVIQANQTKHPSSTDTHNHTHTSLSEHNNPSISECESIDTLILEIERITYHEIKLIGSTFDILLFKNRSMISKVQRLFTGSDYDHVGMLLRSQSNELCILDASSNYGVAIYSFNSLLNSYHNKYYARVVIRKYEGINSEWRINQLQMFLKSAVGKKYKFDPMYLLSSDVKKSDTYFCSELVAEVLKYVGILEEELPSYKCLPGIIVVIENILPQICSI